MMPSMVLSAFAAELFLKTLLVLEGQNPPEIHHLGTLFKRIHNNRTKTQIKALWDASVAEREGEFQQNKRFLGITIPRDLRSALSDCGDAFKLLRYAYEDPAKGKFYIVDFPKFSYNYRA